jgi:type IV pilus assembly protein PilQ
MPQSPGVLMPSSSVIPGLLPEQAISGFDFKRGDKGEGRILITLANPNTMVNTREQAGKVTLTFVNTRLPANLAKRLDVSDFATPVKYIEAVSSANGAILTVVMENNLYDYSLFQTDRLLTVEFRPLSSQEKEAMEKSRVKYTGDRLSLNFQEIEVRSVIAILAEFTGQNVVAGDDVTGTITLKLDDVPWDEALDFIMMTKGLGKYESGNVILISPLDKIKSYKEKQRATEQVVELLDPLVTEYIKINYATAGGIVNLLNGTSARGGACGPALIGTGSLPTVAGFVVPPSGTSSGVGAPSAASGAGTGAAGGLGASLGSGSSSSNQQQQVGLNALSIRGSAVVDERTNTLIIRDTAKHLEMIKQLIYKLDVPVRQVMIESRIVVASDTFAKTLGVKFGGAKWGMLDSSKQFALGGPGTSSSMAAGGDVTTTVTDQLVNLGNVATGASAATPYGALGMTLARGADYVLNLELQALQQQSKGEIISNPRVMTADRCQATITQGTQIPYVSVTGTGVSATASTQLVAANLELDVTPQITPNDSIIMKLKITNNSPTGNEINGQVGISTKEITTNVHVLDGETVVLGGVLQDTISHNVNSIPFFSSLPGIGFLFKNNKDTNDKQELLIFVTPKIAEKNITDH